MGPRGRWGAQGPSIYNTKMHYGPRYISNSSTHHQVQETVAKNHMHENFKKHTKKWCVKNCMKKSARFFLVENVLENRVTHIISHPFSWCTFWLHNKFHALNVFSRTSGDLFFFTHFRFFTHLGFVTQVFSCTVCFFMHTFSCTICFGNDCFHAQHPWNTTLFFGLGLGEGKE